jgi:cell division protein FtsA
MRGARVETRPDGVVGLDLGGSKAIALVALPDGDGFRIHGWAECACSLTSAGVIADLGAARAVLGDLLRAAADQGGVRLRRVVAGVGGGQVRCVRARGTTRTKLPVVLQPSHLDRSLDAAADIGLPRDHEVLHVLPSAYHVDGVRVVKSPLGMRARSVTAEAAVVTVRSQVLDVLQRVIDDAGYELAGAVAEPLAAARAALTAEDRTRGAILVDIGAETTAAAAYRDGVVQGVAWVQAGGVHVTRDVAFALQVDIEQAEALKRRAGAALVESVAAERQVDVQRGRERLSVSQQTLAGVVEARMEELFGMVRDALRAQGALGLGDRIVLAGGGARLRGAVELAEQVFEAPARLAQPTVVRGWREADGDPACCTAIGILEYARRSGLMRAEPAPWVRVAAGLRRALAGGARHAVRLGGARPRARVTTAIDVTDPAAGMDLGGRR